MANPFSANMCCVCVCVCGVCGSDNSKHAVSVQGQCVNVVCGVWGVCGSDDYEHAVSVQGRAYVQLIGWQNTWEQAPGVPATRSPP